MRRTLIIYGLTLAVFCGMALIGLGSLSESLIDYWQGTNHINLPFWITKVPIVTRVALLIPGLLFVASLFAIKSTAVSDLHLVHGMGFTAISLALVTIVTISGGMLPAMVTIMRLTGR